MGWMHEMDRLDDRMDPQSVEATCINILGGERRIYLGLMLGQFWPLRGGGAEETVFEGPNTSLLLWRRCHNIQGPMSQRPRNKRYLFTCSRIIDYIDCGLFRAWIERYRNSLLRTPGHGGPWVLLHRYTFHLICKKIITFILRPGNGVR